MTEITTQDDLLAQAVKLKIELTGNETETEIASLIEAVGSMQSEPDTIKVVATQRGARPTTGLVMAGETFTITPDQYSASWMKAVDAKAAKAIKAEIAKREAAKKKAGAE